MTIIQKIINDFSCGLPGPDVPLHRLILRLFEIEVNSGRIFTVFIVAEYLLYHYSPRLESIIVLEYTHEVILTTIA